MKYYLNIDRDDAAGLIRQLVRVLEYNNCDITFELAECIQQSEGETVFYIDGIESV